MPVTKVYDKISERARRLFVLRSATEGSRIVLEREFQREMSRKISRILGEVSRTITDDGTLDICVKQAQLVKRLPYKERAPVIKDFLSTAFNPARFPDLSTSEEVRGAQSTYTKWFHIMYELGAVAGLRSMGYNGSSVLVERAQKRIEVKKGFFDKVIYELTDAEILNQLENREVLFGRGISRDTILDARGMVKSDIFLGNSTAMEVAEKLKVKYHIPLVRGEKIARTETQQAFNGACNDMYRRSGVKYHTWSTVGDDRVRPEHLDNDGSKVEMGKEFPSGQLHPGDGPLSINCRCSVFPDLSDKRILLEPWQGGPGGDSTTVGDQGSPSNPTTITGETDPNLTGLGTSRPDPRKRVLTPAQRATARLKVITSVKKEVEEAITKVEKRLIELRRRTRRTKPRFDPSVTPQQIANAEEALWDTRKQLQYVDDLLSEERVQLHAAQLRTTATKIHGDTTGEVFGATFNMDGTVYEGTDAITTLKSFNLTHEQVASGQFESLLRNYEAIYRELADVPAGQQLKIGIFKMPDGKVSIDFNIATPKRSVAKQIATLNNQDSFWDAAKFEVVPTGGTGQSVIKDAQIIELIKNIDEVEAMPLKSANPWVLRGENITDFKTLEQVEAMDQAIVDAFRTRETTEQLFVTAHRIEDGTPIYTPARATLHDEIIVATLEGSSAVDEPVSIMMGGGSGAGKGTVRRSGKMDLPQNLATVNSDDIKEMIPEYTHMVDNGDDAAAAIVHAESSDVARRALDESIESGRNTMLDGTGNSSMAKVQGRVDRLRKTGNRVEAHYVTIDMDEAFKRATQRAKDKGRKVPDDIIKGTHEGVSKIFPKLVDENVFDEVTLWDNMGKPPTKILTQKDGITTIHDADKWESFLRKNPDYRPNSWVPKPGTQIDDLTSFDRHRISSFTENGRTKFTPSRTSMHDEIVDEIISVNRNNELVTAVDEPVSYMMGGGSGSGKGTLLDVKQSAGDLGVPVNTAIVDSDRVKDYLPEYQTMLEAGDPKAAMIVHDESSHIGTVAVRESMRRNQNTLIDGTGDGGYGALREKIKILRETGNKVEANYATIDTSLAVARAEERARKSGRAVPNAVIKRTHEQVSKVVPRALDEGLWDKFTLWDTTDALNGNATKILSLDEGRIFIHDAEKWESFLRKNPDYIPNSWKSARELPELQRVARLNPDDFIPPVSLKEADDFLVRSTLSDDPELLSLLPERTRQWIAESKALYDPDLPVRGVGIAKPSPNGVKFNVSQGRADLPDIDAVGFIARSDDNKIYAYGVVDGKIKPIAISKEHLFDPDLIGLQGRKRAISKLNELQTRVDKFEVAIEMLGGTPTPEGAVKFEALKKELELITKKRAYMKRYDRVLTLDDLRYEKLISDDLFRAADMRRKLMTHELGHTMQLPSDGMSGMPAARRSFVQATHTVSEGARQELLTLIDASKLDGAFEGMQNVTIGNKLKINFTNQRETWADLVAIYTDPQKNVILKHAMPETFQNLEAMLGKLPYKVPDIVDERLSNVIKYAALDKDRNNRILKGLQAQYNLTIDDVDDIFRRFSSVDVRAIAQNPNLLDDVVNDALYIIKTAQDSMDPKHRVLMSVTAKRTQELTDTNLARWHATLKGEQGLLSDEVNAIAKNQKLHRAEWPHSRVEKEMRELRQRMRTLQDTDTLIRAEQRHRELRLASGRVAAPPEPFSQRSWNPTSTRDYLDYGVHPTIADDIVELTPTEHLQRAKYILEQDLASPENVALRVAMDDVLAGKPLPPNATLQTVNDRVTARVYLKHLDDADKTPHNLYVGINSDTGTIFFPRTQRGIVGDVIQLPVGEGESLTLSKVTTNLTSSKSRAIEDALSDGANDGVVFKIRAGADAQRMGDRATVADLLDGGLNKPENSRAKNQVLNRLFPDAKDERLRAGAFTYRTIEDADDVATRMLFEDAKTLYFDLHGETAESITHTKAEAMRQLLKGNDASVSPRELQQLIDKAGRLHPKERASLFEFQQQYVSEYRARAQARALLNELDRAPVSVDSVYVPFPDGLRIIDTDLLVPGKVLEIGQPTGKAEAFLRLNGPTPGKVKPSDLMATQDSVLTRGLSTRKAALGDTIYGIDDPMKDTAIMFKVDNPKGIKREPKFKAYRRGEGRVSKPHEMLMAGEFRVKSVQKIDGVLEVNVEHIPPKLSTDIIPQKTITGAPDEFATHGEFKVVGVTKKKSYIEVELSQIPTDRSRIKTFHTGDFIDADANIIVRELIEEKSYSQLFAEAQNDILVGEKVVKGTRPTAMLKRDLDAVINGEPLPKNASGALIERRTKARIFLNELDSTDEVPSHLYRGDRAISRSGKDMREVTLGQEIEINDRTIVTGLTTDPKVAQKFALDRGEENWPPVVYKVRPGAKAQKLFEDIDAIDSRILEMGSEATPEYALALRQKRELRAKLTALQEDEYYTAGKFRVVGKREIPIDDLDISQVMDTRRNFTIPDGVEEHIIEIEVEYVPLTDDVLKPAADIPKPWQHNTQAEEVPRWFVDQFADVKPPTSSAGRKSLDALKKDILEHGILDPIEISIDDAGRALVTNGNRRLIAAKELGIEDVPVVVKKQDGALARKVNVKDKLFDPDWKPTTVGDYFDDEMFELTTTKVAKQWAMDGTGPKYETITLFEDLYPNSRLGGFGARGEAKTTKEAIELLSKRGTTGITSGNDRLRRTLNDIFEGTVDRSGDTLKIQPGGGFTEIVGESFSNFVKRHIRHAETLEKAGDAAQANHVKTQLVRMMRQRAEARAIAHKLATEADIMPVALYRGTGNQHGLINSRLYNSIGSWDDLEPGQVIELGGRKFTTGLTRDEDMALHFAFQSGTRHEGAIVWKIKPGARAKRVLSIDDVGASFQNEDEFMAAGNYTVTKKTKKVYQSGPYSDVPKDYLEIELEWQPLNTPSSVDPKLVGIEKFKRLQQNEGNVRLPTKTKLVQSELGIPETGKPFEFTYAHNTESAVDYGKRYGQHVEPSGKYVTVVNPKNVVDQPTIETGIITLEKPLVVDFGAGYSDATNWKYVLSERFGGKTGRELSEAITDAGYDGIVTVTETRGTKHTSEIIALRKNPDRPLHALSPGRELRPSEVFDAIKSPDELLSIQTQRAAVIAEERLKEIARIRDIAAVQDVAAQRLMELEARYVRADVAIQKARAERAQVKAKVDAVNSQIKKIKQGIKEGAFEPEDLNSLYEMREVAVGKFQAWDDEVNQLIDVDASLRSGLITPSQADAASSPTFFDKLLRESSAQLEEATELINKREGVKQLKLFETVESDILKTLKADLAKIDDVMQAEIHAVDAAQEAAEKLMDAITKSENAQLELNFAEAKVVTSEEKLVGAAKLKADATQFNNAEDFIGAVLDSEETTTVYTVRRVSAKKVPFPDEAPDGHIRMYRGVNPDRIEGRGKGKYGGTKLDAEGGGVGRWYTTDYEEAVSYANWDLETTGELGPNRAILAVDVPNEDAVVFARRGSRTHLDEDDFLAGGRSEALLDGDYASRSVLYEGDEIIAGKDAPHLAAKEIEITIPSEPKNWDSINRDYKNRTGEFGTTSRTSTEVKTIDGIRYESYADTGEMLEGLGYEHMVAIRESDDRVVGTLFYGPDVKDPTEVGIKGAVGVAPDMRRRGIATNMYDMGEEVTGEVFKPDIPHSPDAQAFWKSRQAKKDIPNNTRFITDKKMANQLAAMDDSMEVVSYELPVSSLQDDAPSMVKYSKGVDNPKIKKLENTFLEVSQETSDPVTKGVRYTDKKTGGGLMNRSNLNLDKLTDDEHSELVDLWDFGLQQPLEVPSDAKFAFTLEGEQQHERLLELLTKASKNGVVREEIEFVGTPVWASSDGQIAFNPLTQQVDNVPYPMAPKPRGSVRIVDDIPASQADSLDDAAAAKVTGGMTEDEFMKKHKTGDISSDWSYRAGGLDHLVGPEVSKAEKYPEIVGKIVGKNGKTYEVRASGKRIGYSKVDASGELVRGRDGIALKMTPEEIKRKGLAEFDKSRVVFDGDTPVALVSDESGTVGLWVTKPNQRQGIGSELLARFMKENPNMTLGKMTQAGENTSRATYRKLLTRNAGRNRYVAGAKQADNVASTADDAAAAKVTGGMTEDEFMKKHKTGDIPFDAYADTERGGGLDHLVGPEVEPLTELPDNLDVTYGGKLGPNKKKYYVFDETGVRKYGRHDTYEAAKAEALENINIERGVGGKYPDKVGEIVGKNGKTYEVRASGERIGYNKGDASTGELMRDAKGNPISMTPDEIKKAGVPEFDQSRVVFDGDTPIALVSNEFGSVGLWVTKPNQRQGIGSELLARFMKENPHMKLGKMTPAGEKVSRAAYRKLAKGQTILAEVPIEKINVAKLKMSNDVYDLTPGDMDPRLLHPTRHSGTISATDSVGNAVGAVDYRIVGDEVHIKYIGVNPQYRRQGVGTKLIETVESNFEGKTIVRGITTPEGSEFLEAYDNAVELRAAGLAAQNDLVAANKAAAQATRQLDNVSEKAALAMARVDDSVETKRLNGIIKREGIYIDDNTRKINTIESNQKSLMERKATEINRRGKPLKTTLAEEKRLTRNIDSVQKEIEASKRRALKAKKDLQRRELHKQLQLKKAHEKRERLQVIKNRRKVQDDKIVKAKILREQKAKDRALEVKQLDEKVVVATDKKKLDLDTAHTKAEAAKVDDAKLAQTQKEKQEALVKDLKAKADKQAAEQKKAQEEHKQNEEDKAKKEESLRLAKIKKQALEEEQAKAEVAEKARIQAEQDSLAAALKKMEQDVLDAIEAATNSNLRLQALALQARQEAAKLKAEKAWFKYKQAAESASSASSLSDAADDELDLTEEALEYLIDDLHVDVVAMRRHAASLKLAAMRKADELVEAQLEYREAYSMFEKMSKLREVEEMGAL